MSATLSGRVVTDGGAGIPGLRVVVRDESALIESNITTTTTDGSGNYSASIPDDPFAQDWDLQSQTALGPIRSVGVHIYAAKGPRQLNYSSYHVTSPTTPAKDVTLRSADVTGWAVSLPGTTNALPMRKGNAVRLLVDDKIAWEHLAQVMSAAQKSINVMQLEMDLRKFNATQSQERPEIILAFPETYDTLHPTALDGTTPNRLERILLDAASAGKQVRIMISDGSSALRTVLEIVGIAVGLILLVPLLVTCWWFKPLWEGLGALWNSIFSDSPSGGVGAVTSYFKAAKSSAKIVGFKTAMLSVVHAKAVLIDTVADAIDNAEAILLGSPFSPSYWDTLNHLVYEPRRGDCSGEPIPVHDVSIGIRGPAVADVQQQFLVHWNRDSAKADQVVALDPPPSAVTAGSGEYGATVQVVRTVNESTLPGLDAGEQGCLEAYLRAIENATKYIYIENQYFTCDAIGDALVAALNDKSRPDLQVILMVPVVPDMPFYPTWQTNLFERIRRDAGANASRFGVFTAWTHEAADPSHKHKHPMIMPNYLHTKTAVVDGLWATIGSANLDGASMDQLQYLRPLQFGHQRNDEINCLIFNGVDGADATDAVDQLRLELWSEHLGIPDNDARLDKTTLETSKGWLKLWTDQATAKLQALINDASTIDSSNGRVLAYPPGATSGFGLLLTWSSPHKNFLQTSKIGGKAPDLTKLDLVEHTTAFNYKTGKWADQ
jgi:phosphatidylserine/phosphatidylglycerophosphate/cardiolipin synthase-like enzyme